MILSSISSAISRAGLNGTFALAEKRNIVTVTNKDAGSVQATEVIQRPDQNGQLAEAAREVREQTKTGDKATTNTANYELDKAQKALRLPPAGRRNGQATNPGSSFRLGLSARHATSTPETRDWRKKLATTDAIAASPYRDANGGRKRKLTPVAPTTAASPTGRSAGAHPEIMSQNARKNAARAAATRDRLREPFPAGALNAAIQDHQRTRRVV